MCHLLFPQDFLQQNAFTDFDFTCPLAKSIGMLRAIVAFYNNSQRAIADSPADAKVTWAVIRETLKPVLQKVVDSKFVLPKTPLAEMNAHYNKLTEEVCRAGGRAGGAILSVTA